MASERIEVELNPHGTQRAFRHAPEVFGQSTNFPNVLATTATFDESHGLFIAGTRPSYAETFYEKQVGPDGRRNGSSRKEYAFITPIVNASPASSPLELSADDSELLAKITPTTEACAWLALYGYLETYGESRVTHLPAYKGLIYTGIGWSDAPEELREVLGHLHNSSTGAFRYDYENPKLFEGLRAILPVTEPAVS